MKKLNFEITLLKVFFTFAVLFYHTCKITSKPIEYLFPGGYLAVEFFFIVSGYFMAASIVRNSKNGIDYSGLGFVLHKMKAIYPHIIVAFVINFFIQMVFIKNYPIEKIAEIGICSIGELSFLTFSGIKFSKFYFNGPTWYLSSMVIGMLLLYPFVKKNVYRFGSSFAPIISIIAYAIICQNFKCIDYATKFVSITTVGTIRAIAALSLGVCLYSVVEGFKNSKFELTAIGNKITRIICCLLFILLVAMMVLPSFSPHKMFTEMCFIVYLFTFLFLLLISDGSIKFLNNKITRFLAVLSLPLYLNHRIWLYLLNDKFSYLDMSVQLTIYFVASIITAIIAIPLERRLTKLFKYIGSLALKEKPQE